MEELEAPLVELLEHLQVFQQHGLVAEQPVRDLVDLAAHRLVARDEGGDGARAREEAFPPAPLPPRLDFLDLEAAERRDHLAQRLADGTRVLVPHALEHLVRDGVQPRLRARAELHDRLRVLHVELGDPAVDLLLRRRVERAGDLDLGLRLRQRLGAQLLGLGGRGRAPVLVGHGPSQQSSASRSRSTSISISSSVRSSSSSVSRPRAKLRSSSSRSAR